MAIKHMPSGLFPHFDSALERRPFFVKAGDTVRFGCRLDGSKAASVRLEITDDHGTRSLPERITAPTTGASAISVLPIT